jgi:hypothetical protein
LIFDRINREAKTENLTISAISAKRKNRKSQFEKWFKISKNLSQENRLFLSGMSLKNVNLTFGKIQQFLNERIFNFKLKPDGNAV